MPPQSHQPLPLHLPPQVPQPPPGLLLLLKHPRRPLCCPPAEHLSLVLDPCQHLCPLLLCFPPSWLLSLVSPPRWLHQDHPSCAFSLGLLPCSFLCAFAYPSPFPFPFSLPLHPHRHHPHPHRHLRPPHLHPPLPRPPPPRPRPRPHLFLPLPPSFFWTCSSPQLPSCWSFWASLTRRLSRRRRFPLFSSLASCQASPWPCRYPSFSSTPPSLLRTFPCLSLPFSRRASCRCHPTSSISPKFSSLFPGRP
mmetsp:Transcript_67854/g.108626  ORF Transcript_67854/g.108626 Transcript_67854/m.108626 type:complete len:250 (-) Transcript_67854:691-1440(-)